MCERPGEADVLRDHVAVGVVGVGRRPGAQEAVEWAVRVGGRRGPLNHLYPVPDLVVCVGDSPPGPVAEVRRSSQSYPYDSMLSVRTLPLPSYV